MILLESRPSLFRSFTAANVSKNRYGITEDIMVSHGVNPFANLIKS